MVFTRMRSFVQVCRGLYYFPFLNIAYQGCLLKDDAMSMTDLHGNKQNTHLPLHTISCKTVCTLHFSL